MAKRKRLTPPAPEAVTPEGGLEHKAFAKYPLGVARMRTMPSGPIADVAAAQAAKAALEEITDELRAARDGGRLVQSLPLEIVDETHLVRDRLGIEDEALAELIDSIRDRGQQTPIEVVDLGGDRYGLLSGWRRLTALKRLYVETGDDRFAKVQALLRQPEAASDAYRAMVEENEIRLGLSFYERARIAAKAAEEGAFETPRDAVKMLFAAAPRARRSKINSFIAVYDALDDVLRFPSALPERLGLAIAKALGDDGGARGRLRAALTQIEPKSSQAEQKALQQALSAPVRPSRPEAREVAPGLTLIRSGSRVVLEGAGVDAAFEAELAAWLKSRN